ncbi:MAG: sulfotransferase [Alphaproteobacteria bacterium]|uniref:Sulfotransferase family protein n=1 Tax=Celeribacter baekdonensis TaxID=875171 RepID=A0A2R4M2F7_9RHOB|nr:sulfotransferase [Celeribacter baekdonensis]MBU1280729.1 sulfotransferase [Alphaproteobacteria bacterium]AVW91355.1 hypothetical protein DA792_09895 [Celeribacter baekdonensis]MBU1573885.1 sulfotransferase [Alphaproteobacteria bacterium]MBU1830167.1 sulfotransferase [Alphaproteobacteria bacterium]MBU2078108.1 sulfotransferase [Alphaproteobacteria bacterium]
MKITNNQFKTIIKDCVARNDIFGAELVCAEVIKNGRLCQTARIMKSKLEKKRDAANAGFAELFRSYRSFLKDERNSEALKCCTEMKKKYPHMWSAWACLGEALLIVHSYKLAEFALVRAIELNPYNKSASLNLLTCLVETQNVVASATYAQKILDIWGDSVEIRRTLQRLHSGTGDKSAEKKDLEFLLSKMPNDVPSLVRLAEIEKLDKQSDIYKVSVELLNSEKSVKTSVSLCWLIAKLSERSGDYAESAAYLKKGAALQFDPEKDNLSHYRKRFEDSLELASFRGVVDSEIPFTPIFVVGLPRSGTSLMEQLLSEAKDVTGAGELPYFTRNQHASDDKGVLSERLSMIRANYSRDVHMLAKDRFVVDKMPHNFLSIGAIKRAFPEGKIIYMKRDLRAIAWSQFKSKFSSDGLAYTYNEGSIVEHFEFYMSVMDRWAELHPQDFLEVDYDKMVADPASYLPQVFQYCGLEFNENYLDFHKKGKVTFTASVDQVRKGIYGGSSNSWKNYEPYFSEFFEKLTKLEMDRKH